MSTTQSKYGRRFAQECKREAGASATSPENLSDFEQF